MQHSEANLRLTSLSRAQDRTIVNKKWSTRRIGTVQAKVRSNSSRNSKIYLKCGQTSMSRRGFGGGSQKSAWIQRCRAAWQKHLWHRINRWVAQRYKELHNRVRVTKNQLSPKTQTYDSELLAMGASMCLRPAHLAWITLQFEVLVTFGATKLEHLHEKISRGQGTRCMLTWL